MDEKKLRKAQLISSEIWQTERDIQDIIKILDDYNSFGSTISFFKNSDGYSRSFGSKKNKFREDLENLLIDLKTSKEKELISLKEQFSKL
jgi:hypothetical protein